MPARTPSEIHNFFIDAFNRGDVDAIVALYELDAVLVISGQTLIGHEAIRDAYRNMLASRGRMELETRSVVDSGEGLAVLHASWSLHIGESTARGVSTEVVRRQSDGRWLFVIDEPRTPE